MKGEGPLLNEAQETKGLSSAAGVHDVDLEVRGVAEFPACPDVVEDAPTLEGNAEKKARWIAACTGLLTLADDTGLEVEALAGAPGVYSARYAGPGCSYSDNNARLLRELVACLPNPQRLERLLILGTTPQPASEAV